MKKISFIAAVEISDCIGYDHIYKDVCLIPVLMKEEYGFEAEFISYGIDEKLMNTYFKDISCVNINKTGNYLIDIKNYLEKNAVNIDIAYILGPYKSYELICRLYKLCNPDGKIYLKLDMNRYWLNNIVNEQYFRNLLEISDLITAEDRAIQNTINEIYNCEVEYLRNGFYEFFKTPLVNYKEKKNIILSVGRLGTDQKRTKTLLEAFLKADLPDWELRLVGSIEKEFSYELEALRTTPKFASQVKILGRIEDKSILYDEYRKAKIFCMTSKYEGCAHVYSEAAYNGCYIISTDVDGIRDFAEYDSIVPIDDYNTLAREFENISKNNELMAEKCYAIQEYIRNEGIWNIVISKLYLLFCIKGLV